MLSVLSQLIPISNYNSTFSTFMGKIVQNVNFSPVSKICDLNSKLNHTRQNESRCIFGFQNKAHGIKLLKFHRNRDNNANLEKRDFQMKLVSQF